MNEEDTKFQWPYIVFCPKGKTLSYIGHLNLTVLQMQQKPGTYRSYAKVKPMLTYNDKTWKLRRKKKRKMQVTDIKCFRSTSKKLEGTDVDITCLNNWK